MAAANEPQEVTRYDARPLIIRGRSCFWPFSCCSAIFSTARRALIYGHAPAPAGASISGSRGPTYDWRWWGTPIPAFGMLR